jgi:hypothetical protein
MAQILIVTTPPNSGLGDSLQTAFNKCNSNFADLYTGAPTGLPAATGSLSGLEIVVVNSAGQPETVTTAQIAALSSSSAYSLGNPNQSASAWAAAGNFSQQGAWITAFPTLSGVGLSGSSNTGISPGWTIYNSEGTDATQYPNGSASTIAGTVAMIILTSAATANSAANYYSTAFNPSSPNITLARGFSNGAPVAGFTMTLYFVITSLTANAQLYFGLTNNGGNNGGFTATQTPSAVLNSIALTRDTADVNLQFTINNGAGSGSKTSLGVTAANLQNQLLRLVITCDNVGNCAITLTNLETSGTYAGMTFSATYPLATAKLPVTFTGSGGANLQPEFYMNNGGAAAAVGYGIVSSYITAGFGGI